MESPEDICLSGGASGADLAWGAAAEARGDRVTHFSFAGHRTRAPRRSLEVLSSTELRAADAPLRRAAQELRRDWPPRSDYAAALLRRDWYQVKDSERLYAVASFRDDGQIEGGTAWTVAMFLGRHDRTESAAFLFDQAARQWLAWQDEWRPIAAPPLPCGRWTGIGTRRLNAAGATAIRALLSKRKALS